MYFFSVISRKSKSIKKNNVRFVKIVPKRKRIKKKKKNRELTMNMVFVCGTSTRVSPHPELHGPYFFVKVIIFLEKIGNFRLEPPGLFRGRGEHPKMGRLKKRIRANEIIINCSKGSDIPKPPPGQKWKEVRHDDKVTWLACWIENVQGGYKYIMLGANSRTKGEKDWMKYEKARELKKIIQKIRDDYERDYKSKLMYERQRAIAMYFIDKLALRAGNEKDTDEAADTVGCCSLRVEHVQVRWRSF